LLTKIAGKCGKRQIEETDELSFFASAIKEGRSRRRRLQMQLALPKTIFEFGLPSIIAYSQFVLVYGFFKIHIFLVVFFPQNHDSQYATELPAFQPALHSSFSNTKRRTRYRRGLCTSSKYISFNVFIMYVLGSVHEQLDV